MSIFWAGQVWSMWAQAFSEVWCLNVPKVFGTWSTTTLNHWMMVERYPNIKEGVGGSIPGYETSSLLNKKTCQVVNCLLYFGDGLLAFYNQKKEKKKNNNEEVESKLCRSKLLTWYVITRGKWEFAKWPQTLAREVHPWAKQTTLSSVTKKCHWFEDVSWTSKELRYK